MLISSAPGKLFIAGEYAVTHPGYPAILVAVDKFITLSIEKALYKGSIDLGRDRPISWTRDKDEIVLDGYKHGLPHIRFAIKMVETYIQELGKKPNFYHLKIESQLRSKEGKKYGLGSSAALIVSLVNALCAYYEIPISPDELFKLSSLANLHINRASSCGDIAASVYGGWIAFTSFDRKWVLKQQKNKSIKELISTKWPGLSIEPLNPPKELRLVVGWTGEPASTTKLLEQINQSRLKNNRAYRNFLYGSKICVNKMIKAFREADIKGIQKQVQINRQLLIDLGKDLGVEIESLLLTKLCHIGQKYKGYGKPRSWWRTCSNT